MGDDKNAGGDFNRGLALLFGVGLLGLFLYACVRGAIEFGEDGEKLGVVVSIAFGALAVYGLVGLVKDIGSRQR